LPALPEPIEVNAALTYVLLALQWIQTASAVDAAGVHFIWHQPGILLVGAVLGHDVPSETESEEEGDSDVASKLHHLPLPLSPKISRHCWVLEQGAVVFCIAVAQDVDPFHVALLLCFLLPPILDCHSEVTLSRFAFAVDAPAVKKSAFVIFPK